MSLAQFFIIFSAFLIVSCGGQYEAPHEADLSDIGAQTTNPATSKKISRIDCEVEMQTVNGQIIRLSDSSAIFKMNEEAGSVWSASSVVIPMSQYSLLARYSKTSLNPLVKGPSFYVVLCENNLTLNSECASGLVIKASERTGTLTSTIDNEIKANVLFPYDQYQINQVRANCTLNIQPIN